MLKKRQNSGTGSRIGKKTNEIEWDIYIYAYICMNYDKVITTLWWENDGLQWVVLDQLAIPMSERDLDIISYHAQRPIQNGSLN